MSQLDCECNDDECIDCECNDDECNDCECNDCNLRKKESVSVCSNILYHVIPIVGLVAMQFIGYTLMVNLFKI
jgi:hypothetical protein